jgi:hypothetical protein
MSGLLRRLAVVVVVGLTFSPTLAQQALRGRGLLAGMGRLSLSAVVVVVVAQAA